MLISQMVQELSQKKHLCQPQTDTTENNPPHYIMLRGGGIKIALCLLTM